MRRLSIKEALHKYARAGFICGVIAVLLCWFMKSFGLDYFELDLDNKFFNDLDALFTKYYLLKQIYFTLTLLLQVYLVTCIVQEQSGKKIWKYLLLTSPLTIGVRILTSVFVNELGNMAVLVELLYMLLITSKFNIKLICRALLINIVSILYQYISINTRSLELKAHELGFVATQILYIDYYILLYLHKEVCLMNDGTFFFFGLTA